LFHYSTADGYGPVIEPRPVTENRAFDASLNITGVETLSNEGNLTKLPAKGWQTRL